MQLRKMVVMLTALGAMGLMMTGCDGDTATAGLCTDDTSCTGNEICHPTAKVCVSTCETSNDCPANAKNCAAVAGATQMVCQCSTDQLCNQDREAADQVCSTVDKVCVTACSADTDCPTGRTCDTATGQCLAGNNTDACGGLCNEDETCDTTGSTPVCRPTAGETCEGTSQSTCAYGDFCSANQCVAAPVADATCQNFGSNRPEWNPSTSSGPVIYDITTLKFVAKGNQYCDEATQAEIVLSVRAYRTDQDWPSTRSGLSGFFYVNTQQQTLDIVGRNLLVPGTGYNRNSANLKDAEFQVYLCPPLNTSSLPVALYFTGGNPTCPIITR